MSTLSVAQCAPSWTPKVAVILGGDASARHHATGLLADAGFDVRTAASAQILDAPAEPGGLIVLLGPASESVRVREVRTAAASHPHARILAVMPAHARGASARRAILAGATGIVSEDEVDRALVATAQAMLAGQLAVPTTLSRQIAPRPLSHREKQIMSLVVQGLTNQEIAGRLYLAESTVKTHLSSAFRKLDARSRSEAVARIQDPEAGYGLGMLVIADLAAT